MHNDLRCKKISLPLPIRLSHSFPPLRNFSVLQRAPPSPSFISSLIQVLSHTLSRLLFSVPAPAPAPKSYTHVVKERKVFTEGSGLCIHHELSDFGESNLKTRLCFFSVSCFFRLSTQDIYKTTLAKKRQYVQIKFERTPLWRIVMMMTMHVGII